jgi:hypothetical protein
MLVKEKHGRLNEGFKEPQRGRANKTNGYIQRNKQKRTDAVKGDQGNISRLGNFGYTHGRLW